MIIVTNVMPIFKYMPNLVVFFARSIFFAPRFCPTIAVTVCPIAQQGIPAKVLTFNPIPEAAVTEIPKLLSISITNT